MDNSKASSNSITSSTVSRESALRSLMKCVSLVISLLSTPICSLTISITFCSVSSIGIPCLPCVLNHEKFAHPGANAARKCVDYSGRRLFAQPDQPRLARGIICLSRIPGHAGHAADIDDSSAFGPHHGPRRRANGYERALEVGIDHRIEILIIHPQNQTVFGDPGVVYQHIQ